MAETLYITFPSLVCPVGFTPESAAAAMRAGIPAFEELPYVDNSGESIIGAAVPGLSYGLRGRARLVELLSRAFEFLRPGLPQDFVLKALPIMFCTREPDRPGAEIKGIFAEIEDRLSIDIVRDGSKHIARGPVAAFEAIGHARRLISEGPATACLIAAVDTLVDARTLHWLDQAKRLKTSVQSDGVIPGEAACIAIVSKRAITSSPLGVRGLGYAIETATVLNEEPFLGKGMTAAVKNALNEALLTMHEVDFRFSDVGGESYAFEELILAQSRLTRRPRKRQELWHPADCIGDCGTASGLIQFAWAEQAFARGYAPGPVALIHGSSATGARAAAVVDVGDIADVT